MGSAMGGMMGGGSGGGGGASVPGLPQRNGSEQNMPSQDIMGMQVPDFMGAAFKGSEDLKNRPNKFDSVTSSANQMPSVSNNPGQAMGQTDMMLSKLGQYNPDTSMDSNLPTNQNILQNQSGPNPISNPMNKNPYGLGLGNVSNMGL